MSLQECIERIKEVSKFLDDDDPDKIEMLNIEGDYTQLMNWALQKRAEHTATAEAAKALSKKYSDRGQSFEYKADTMKGIIETIMDSANETKFSSESGTASFRNIAPKPVIMDESKLPKKYIKVKESVDKVLINKDIKDGVEIDGVTMDNGGRSLTIRL